jgi:hypothetical protein
MPAAVAAGIAKTALAAPVVGGGIGSALGAGLTAGASLASGAGIFSNFMAGAAPGLGGTLGGVAPAVATKIAPAATSQLMGTIGGSVAPGAFGANLAGASQGLVGTAGGVTPGAFGANLASTLPNAATPTIEQMAAKYLAGAQAKGMPIANANNLNFLRSSVADTTAKTMPLETLNSFSPVKQGLDPSVLQRASLSNPTAQAVNPADIVGRSIRPDQNFMQNLGNIGSFQDVKDYAEQHPYATSAMAGLGAMGISKLMQPQKVPTPEDKSMIRPYTYERTQRPEAYETSPTMDSSERNYFNDQFIAGEPYKATEKAEGGIAAAYAVGGPVEQMAAMNAVGANTGYPMANLQTPMYANPSMQRPEATNVIAPSADAGVGAYSGEARFAKGGETETEGGYSYSYNPQTMQFTQLSVPTIKPSTANQALGMNPHTAPATPPTPQYVKNSGSKISGGIATPAMGPMQMQQAAPLNIPAYQTPEQQLGLEGFYDYMNQQLGGYGGYAKGGNVGGESHLGDYSDGGRLLKGPGDGVSDSIPASIGGRQPARLADGEFVVPARIVSELGNGSTEAGARKLYAMMDRIQKGRRKSVGKGKVAVNSKADKHLPA